MTITRFVEYTVASFTKELVQWTYSAFRVVLSSNPFVLRLGFARRAALFVREKQTKSPIGVAILRVRCSGHVGWAASPVSVVIPNSSRPKATPSSALPAAWLSSGSSGRQMTKGSRGRAWFAARQSALALRIANLTVALVDQPIGRALGAALPYGLIGWFIVQIVQRLGARKRTMMLGAQKLPAWIAGGIALVAANVVGLARSSASGGKQVVTGAGVLIRAPMATSWFGLRKIGRGVELIGQNITSFGSKSTASHSRRGGWFITSMASRTTTVQRTSLVCDDKNITITLARPYGLTSAA